MTTPLILPQLIVEAGISAGAPVEAAGTFTLNDAVNGLLGTGTLGGSAVAWADISADVISGTVTRPFTRVQGPLLTYQAGTSQTVLDNTSGDYDPDNLGGPYVAGGVTQIHAMIPLRWRAVWAGVTYPLFSGFTDSWQDSDVTYDAGYDEVTVSATDCFKILAGTNLAEISPAGGGEQSGARITRILNAAGWYTDHRTVAAGDSAVQATTYGADALSLLQLTTDSEIGELYTDASGGIVFRNRRAFATDTRSDTVQAVFGDLPGTVQTAGTELAYAAAGRANDDTTLANLIQITIAGSSNEQDATSAASVASYGFPRTYNRADILLQTDAEALQYANWVLSVSLSAEDRFETLTVDPLADPVNLFPQVLGRELGDRIQIWRRPQNWGGPVTKDCFIRGITHTVDVAAGTWQTVWALQDASKYGSFLTLDNSTLGKLDSNALAF